MIVSMDGYLLRPVEPADGEAFYKYKNDPEVVDLLGGFRTGYSRADIAEWIERHRKRPDEVVWTIAEVETDRGLGHVGLYNIDHRIRSAEFGIMIGDKSYWGKGIGRRCTDLVFTYGFHYLNLNRIHLSVLATNQRAFRLYRSLGCQEEGRLRQAQYKNGEYVDLILMGLLREEYLNAN